MLGLYVLARLCQLSADRLPTLLIVILHVVPPALFALAHGAVVYGRKGISIFAGCCVGFGALAEVIGLSTGFPFGHYYFTDVMGPKIFQVPVLLALAYLGIGYVAWILALLILGGVDKPICGARVLALPLLASFIMFAWDLSMEPDWSTLDHAWIWRDGGAYLGAPLTNFVGWFGTAYCYYQTFALYLRAMAVSVAPEPARFWLSAILIYVVCALGNLLILKLPMAPAVVADAAGRQWMTGGILRNCILVSVFVMVPFALLAWLRLKASAYNRPTS